MSCSQQDATSRGLVGCEAPADLGPRPHLRTIVRAYIARFRTRSAEELDSFKSEPNVASAIERAGLAKTPCGKRYNHQRRLPTALLRSAASELRRAGLGASVNFDDLHRRIQVAIGSLHGVGELMVYDTSLRIGAKIGYFPQRVYMHSGTRVGARALGLNWRADCLEISAFPQELRALEPHEIEDCLCIFKAQLGSAV